VISIGSCLPCPPSQSGSLADPLPLLRTQAQQLGLLLSEAVGVQDGLAQVLEAVFVRIVVARIAGQQLVLVVNL
jgi:hypothetical protein